METNERQGIVEDCLEPLGSGFEYAAEFLGGLTANILGTGYYILYMITP